MIEALLTQPITIETVTDSTPDRYGHPTAAVTASTVINGHVQQSSAHEDLDDRQVTEEAANCFLPADATITERDRVIVDGTTWQVDGPPRHVFDPMTVSTHHIEVRLRRAQ